MFPNVNIYCDPSLELSSQDGSSEGSWCMFLLEIRNVISELQCSRLEGVTGII